ncbi:MAG TPA: penicillin-binding transpeptidase domain-containing protein [Acidimicrobiales bacterium]|jgi:peptidoglycan glycosyltransferase|nr:penicillin-binding transpeptidase domain-containing protein [Acidimicrobiales bacterium]
MSRRIWYFSVVIAVLFVVVAGQSLWVQWFHAAALNASPINPRNNVTTVQYPRGEIIAANGSVLAESQPTHNSSDPYKRVYPDGALFAGVVGWTSTKYGAWALEYEYNRQLSAHSLPAQNLEEVLAPTDGEDSVTLTLSPSLQELAHAELAGRDGSVVAIVPSTGSLLALYSNPTFNPMPFTSPNRAVQTAAWVKDNKKDAEGYPPLGLVATQQTIFPGSTFKVITTAGIVAYKPSLLTMDYPSMTHTSLPDSDKPLYNDGGTSCGGTVAEMLPDSCDPGYALLGIALGAQDLTAEAHAFGYNEVPPIDLPGAVASFFPTESTLAGNPPFLAYSAIGQEDVSATALENALVAAGIADKGVIMTPHLMAYITGPDGSVLQRYKDSVWKTPLTASEAAQIVPLMRGVVDDPIGTAFEVNFLPQDHVAAKTGTAQVGNNLTNDTDDWMIAFAPADNPTIAIAVSVPFQASSATGAKVAGPIMKCMIEGALALEAHLPITGTSTTCPTPAGSKALQG